MRHSINISMVQERVINIEQIKKPISAPMYTFLNPNRAPNQPADGAAAPAASINPVTVHCAVGSFAENSPINEGIAILTVDVFMTAKKFPKKTAAIIDQNAFSLPLP